MEETTVPLVSTVESACMVFVFSTLLTLASILAQPVAIALGPWGLATDIMVGWVAGLTTFVALIYAIVYCIEDTHGLR